MTPDAERLISERTAEMEQLARRFAAEGATYETSPRASAVALLLWDKLRDDKPSDDVLPIDDLVTPASLADWRRIFANSDGSRSALLEQLRDFHPIVPRVRPQSDGSLVIILAWVHPEMESLTVSEPRMMPVRPITLRLVDNPDDWRVERIG